MEEEKKESSRLKVDNIKNGRLYELILEKDSPLGEVYDVICEYRNYVRNIMDKYEQSEKLNETEGV